MTRDQITTVMTAIREGILVRKGYVITEEVADERARNMVTGLMADIDDMIESALKEAARGVVVGEIDGNRGAQPQAEMRWPGPCRTCGGSKVIPGTSCTCPFCGHVETPGAQPHSQVSDDEPTKHANRTASWDEPPFK